MAGGLESAEAGGFSCYFYNEDFREADQIHQSEYTSSCKIWPLSLLGQG